MRKDCNKIKMCSGLLKRVLAFVLCLAMAITLFEIQQPEKVEASTTEASYKGTAVKNALILKITMGSATTDQIGYFAIKYQDTNKKIRTIFITPDAATLNAGYKKVSSLISGGGTAAGKLNFLNYSGSSSNSIGIGFNACTEHTASLRPLTTDYFYFEVPYDFYELEGVSFLGVYKEGGKNEISIQDISVYSVSYLHDIDMYGTFSNEYYIDFTGKCLFKSKISRSFTWAQTDRVFDFNTLKYADGFTVDFGTQFYSGTYYTHNVDSVRELDNSVKYTVQIDFSDIYGAGASYLHSPVKSFVNTSNYNLYNSWIRESMEIEATYTDLNGLTHTMHVPVVLSYIYKVVLSGGAVSIYSPVSGILQEGDSIIFDIVFPNTETVDVNNLTLKYGRNLVYKDIGFKCKNTVKATSDDAINISNIFVYDTSSVSASFDATTGFIVPTIKGTPLYYFSASGIGGVEISEESTFDINFSKYTGTETTSSKLSGKFLIKLKTDTPAAAGTTDLINVVIHYKSTSGMERITEKYIISEETADYYGYWPTMFNKYTNFGYYYGSGSGGELCFIVDIPDLDSFTGMTFALNSDATDEWQCTSIGIYEITSLGNRTVKWKITSRNGEITDRIISRNVTSKDISPTISGSFLVESGTSVYVEFSGGTSVVEDNDVDWNEYRYEMSYQDALQDLGFTKARAVYTVKVAVSGDLVNGEINEDCGSKNNFYFKLVFEDGSTGYVLANQQLSSDGFTSGATHEFTVSTNKDMGNLTAIKILPENQNDDGSDVFDKLKIEKVVVTKQGDEGLCLSWTVEIDDWITIDYQDSGAKNSARGQTGRTENELAQTFRVSSTGYSLNLMFAIETNSYTDKAFEGRLSAEIDYIDSTNSVVTTKIDDVVAAMYTYAGKSITQKTYTPVNGKDSFTAAAIDRTMFLYKNHTDRFFVSLEDVVSIVRIRLIVKSTTAGRWKVGGVSVYRVKNKGTKMINSNNEYQYNGDVELICQSNSTIPYEIQYIASGTAEASSIVFGDNKIDVDLSSSWISSISYVPQSDDDSINIYAYMSSKAKNIGSYQMKANAHYGLANETTRETTVTLTADTNKNMFYAKNVSVSGLRKLIKLGLKVDSFDTQYAPCDYVIIEHVRSGVVINTYYINYNGLNMDTTGSYYYVKPSTDTENGLEKQTVTFMISSDSLATKLVSDSSDLAVCINYTSSNDPESSLLTSPNLFLSDLGITSLSPGDIITLTFDQQYVEDIKSLSFAGQGSVANNIKIKSARATTEQVDNTGDYAVKNFYSFGEEMSGFVTYSPKNMVITSTTSENISVAAGTEKTVGLLTLSFVTESGSSGLTSGASVRLRIGYYDNYKMTKEMVIDDISSYIVSGSMTAGNTAVAKLLINGISSIRFIEVEPYDDSVADATWALESVTSTLSVDSEGIPDERRVNDTVVEGTPETIGFGDVKVQVVAFISKTGSTSLERRGFSSSSDASEGILLTLGNTIDCTTTIEGSISDMDVKCYSIAVTAAGQTVTSNVTNNVVTINYNEDGTMAGFLFKPDAVGDYRITVSSQELSSIDVEINVSVVE